MTQRPASAMNALHSRITSGVQRSAALAACAAAGLASAAMNNRADGPAAAYRCGRATST